MNLSDIYSAKGLKVKLCFQDSSVHFSVGNLIKIDTSQIENEFIVNQYGKDVSAVDSNPVLCKTDIISSRYIQEMFENEKICSYRNIFTIEGVYANSIDVQTYSFQAIAEYKTPIFIMVSSKLLEKVSVEKLYNEFVWSQLGEPALFCLNYKNRKKQNVDVRFISGKHALVAYKTPRGIIAEREDFLRDRDTLPVDIYIAPEIKFVAETDEVLVNEGMASDLDKVSNSATYFARWEAYNELSKKLLEQESEEFGVINYSSYVSDADLTGITFEFVTDEELDISMRGKELGATPRISKDDEAQERPRQIAVGAIKKINGKRITTYLEKAEGFDEIPENGSLTLYTAGDRFIMTRRDAARERMMKHASPIKYIVALIETGASEYEMPGSWGNHKAVVDKLERNFSKAKMLNPEQRDALDLAINTPDIALIQGPPGTGKTTVIKAICERFREIFEDEERQTQRLNPDHILRGPKILITSFQNEAVDNAISTPLPGDIPAFRKTAKRAKDSSTEQYQKTLEKWYNGVCSAINSQITDKSVAEFVELKKSLSDEYFSYKNSGEVLDDAARLIRRYLTFNGINYPQQLLDDATRIIKASEEKTTFDDIQDPIVARIEALRIDKDSFEDDGRRNAKRFLNHVYIKDDLSISAIIIEAISKVLDDNFTKENFESYKKAVHELQLEYCSPSIKGINPKDAEKVNECLLALYDCFINQYTNSITDLESKKSLILSEFIARLEPEYESIVRKYAMTTAATCQTSLDLRDKNPKVFDLVVIDEAARANPLDLFIPMSMGKKIILVGDQKQLPHMLEPDVLKTIMNDPHFKDLPEIEKSLFERLFDMFEKGQRPKAIRLTHQFRMHPDICKFVSDSFYDEILKTANSVTPELRSSPTSINEGKALTFVNIPYSKGDESRGISKFREIEVEAITNDISKIFDADEKIMHPENKEDERKIGVITFYSAQATKIRQRLEMTLDTDKLSKIEVGTVDAFQGKEFDYVLLSCVRSNRPQNENGQPSVGFLTKPNRLCVAFSRAIRQLIVYGDADTLIQIPCFSKLYNICAIEKGGCYREY